MCPEQHSFAIRRADPERSAAILAFHRAHLTRYLWPRDRAYFEMLAREGLLFEAVETTTGTDEIVGVCYIALEIEEGSGREHGEFGGVYVTYRHRPYGIATALGIVAIAHFFFFDRPRSRLVAHVHESNPDPRGLLQDRLGFVFVGKYPVPPGIAPESMPKNAAGQVVGDLFEFRISELLKFADWFESFPGTIARKNGGTARMEIEVLGFEPEARNDLATALRDIAGQRRYP